MSVVRPDRANEFIQFINKTQHCIKRWFSYWHKFLNAVISINLAGKQVEITHDWCITIIFNISMHFEKVLGACWKLHLQCLVKPKLCEMCCSSSTFCRCHYPQTLS